MWQSLAKFADAELETRAEAAKRSYEKLATATWELQKHVKELLCEYPGPAAEEPAIDEPMGREGDAMGHTARLLSSLCAQPARGDVTSAPGAIYTPKGDARQRAPTDAGPSVFEGASAMKAFLSADVPSMRWDGAAASSGADAGGRLRQLSPTPGCGLLSGQRPTPKLLHVRVDTDMDADAQGTLQRQSDELRAWALAALGGLHPDASLEDVHGALLRDAVQYGALPQREGAAWFRLCVDADVMVRSRQLLAGVFHTGRSSQEAWAGLTQAFAHGLVQPDGEAARMLGAFPNGEASGFRTFDVTPESYQSYIKDLQDKMDELVGELFRESPEDGGSPQAGTSLSEKDVAAYRLGITPRTYLQVIGQKLLYHAALQIPCMAELPERIPHWALRYLYGRPFAEAVRLALQHGVASISDAFGPSGEGPDARVRGGQLAQSLLQSSAGHKDVNPNKADPRQQPRRERADGARARFSFSGVGTSAQRAPPSETDGGGSGGATAATAKVDACQRALGAARSAVDLLIGIEMDVKGFEEGFAVILRGGACGPLRPEKLAQLTQVPVPPHTAAACLSVVQEEVARVLREMGPALRTFLCGSVTAVVQACLAGDDLQTQPQQPCPVPVCAGVWPSLEEDARRPSLDVSGAQAPLQYRNSSSLSSSPRGGGTAAAQSATASDRGDASAFVRSCDARKGGERGDDPHAPPAVDALSHRVLEFVSWMSDCLRQLPEPLQPMLFGAILECLALLMDRLSLICTAPRDMLGSGGGGGGGARPLPLSLAFMFHSAACCARRRLEALRPWKGLGAATMATARQLQDGQSQPHQQQHMKLVQQHGEALLQADELVISIHQHIVMSYMQAVYGVVLSSLDRTDWCAFRPEVMRGQSAGPAVRVWHSMMLRMLHTAALHASPHAAEWIVGQVLLESVSCMAQRYLRACPTVQMLREFVADAVHLAASVFLLAQPIRVSARLRRGGDGGGGRQAAQEPPPQRQDSATDGGANTAVLWLRVPFPTARALAEAAREVLTRAALLHLPGAQLEEIARKAGLLAAATGGMGSVEPDAAADQPLPGFKEPMPPAPPATEQPPAPIDIGGTPGSATGSGVRLASLPAIRSQRSALPTEADANASSAFGPGSLLPVAAASPLTTAASAGKDRSRSTAGEAAAFDAARSESSATAATADPLSGAACVAATDAERLDLFSSWLTGKVVCALTDIAEAIELVGGSRPVAWQLLIPLGDRMADPADQAGPEGQQGLKAAGSMWRSCLVQLAQRASAEQVVLAVARRHELHAAVGTEPPGNAESRRVVRGLARLLGLLLGRPEEDG